MTVKGVDAEVFKPFAVGSFDVAVQEEGLGRFAMTGVDLFFAIGSKVIELLSSYALSSSACRVGNVDIIGRFGDGVEDQNFLEQPFGEFGRSVLADAVGPEPVCEPFWEVSRADEEVERAEVLIAVIAILASLLLPSIGKAKAKALQTQCLNNLKQIGLSTILYAQDHEGTVQINAPLSPGVTWASILSTNQNLRPPDAPRPGPTAHRQS